jgi:NAD(P)-dependent dehydrogenase (short-subunit alcohol dehydrogenase family)
MEKDLFSIKGKVTVVTGGRKGIGKSIAGHLAEAGSDIVIISKHDPTSVAEEIAAKYGVRTVAYKCDVSKQDEVDNSIKNAAEKMGTLDFLLNNAGITIHRNAVDLEPGDWEKIINVNLNGIFYVALAFGRYLISAEKKGSIVNVASISATKVNIPQGQVAYNSSKAAIVNLTKSLAVEWVDKNIRVNCISPGYISTEMSVNVREDWKDIWTGMTPMKRMGTPEELIGAVIYLFSDASTYTTGAEIVIDGGYTLI